MFFELHRATSLHRFCGQLLRVHASGNAHRLSGGDQRLWAYTHQQSNFVPRRVRFPPRRILAPASTGEPGYASRHIRAPAVGAANAVARYAYLVN